MDNDKAVKLDDIIEYVDMEIKMLKAHGQSVACAALRRVKGFAEENAVTMPYCTLEETVDNGWISVEERLPEIGEHYRSKLVMCYSPDGEHECLFDYYEVNGFGQGCFTAEKYFGISITHWMPLPEPPKGECK